MGRSDHAEAFQSLQRGFAGGVSLLALDAPIAQFVDGDMDVGHGATHIIARLEDAKIRIEKLDLRFAGHRTIG